jgi:hypothetical protein
MPYLFFAMSFTTKPFARIMRWFAISPVLWSYTTMVAFAYLLCSKQEFSLALSRLFAWTLLHSMHSCTCLRFYLIRFFGHRCLLRWVSPVGSLWTCSSHTVCVCQYASMLKIHSVAKQDQQGIKDNDNDMASLATFIHHDQHTTYSVWHSFPQLWPWIIPVRTMGRGVE